MTHATVFLILDAARDDYPGPETMPFLHGLREEALTASFESPPGFAQRTVFFTGRYPDTSGNFSAFVYDPENSPFRWVHRLGPLRHAVRPHRIFWPARWAIDKVTGWLSDAYHTDPAWIPPRFIPCFRPCEDMRPVHAPDALGAPSLFDLCRQHGLSYRYLAHPVSGDDQEITRTLVRALRAGEDTDLYVAQLSATDELGHAHGPHSGVMQREVLPRVDQQIATVHAALEAGYDSWDLVVCGDHGMAPVKRHVNVLARLGEADAEPARDYVVFVNSTLAVFWYLTERGRREVEAVLPGFSGATLLDDADRKRLRIPAEPRWGDRMLAAEPGVLFWPDYFHVTGSTIRGMHGYLDKHEEGLGMCVVASSDPSAARGELGARPLVDIFPTLCDLVGVPTPRAQEGTSLFDAPHPGAAGSRDTRAASEVVQGSS